jgi:hypothetical protein
MSQNPSPASPKSFKEWAFDQVMEVNPTEAKDMTEEELRALVTRIQQLRVNPAERRSSRKEVQHKVLGTTSKKVKILGTSDLL